MKKIKVYKNIQGKKTHTRDLLYNIEDNLELEEILNAKGEVDERTNFHYNHLHKIIKTEKWYSSTNKTETVVYNYENENLISVKQLLDGALFFEKVVYFDESNREIKLEIIEDGILIESIITDYEKLSRLTENYNNEKGLISRLTEKLNEAFQVVSEFDELFESPFPPEKTINTFDDLGNLINAKVYENEDLVLNEDYFYDDKNNEIRSEGYDSSTEIKTNIVREFTDQGNLISEIINDNQELVSEKIRSYNTTGEKVYELNKIFNHDHEIFEIEETWYEIEYE